MTALLTGLAWAFLLLNRTGGHYSVLFNGLIRQSVVIFFGWATVATLLNTSQWLVSLGWTPTNQTAQIWAAGLILIAMGIGLLLLRRYGAIAYGLVLLWAFWGIVAAQPTGWFVVGATLLATLVLVSAALLWSRQHYTEQT